MSQEPTTPAATGDREALLAYLRLKKVPQLVEKELEYLGACKPDDVLAGIERWLAAEKVRQCPALTDAEMKTCRLGTLLGKGSFAKVFLGLTTDGRYVAVKQISLAGAEEPSHEPHHLAPTGAATPLSEEVQNAQKEMQLMMRVRHPNLVQCLGSLYDAEARTFSIYMEYVGGRTLAEICKAFGGLPPDVARGYTSQVVAGLAALHGARICHRDIKPENILTDPSRRVVKLCDFGCSKQIDGLSCGKRGRDCMTVAGSPYYMSPEILNDEEGYDGMHADIWSLGATVIQMATGTLPWPKSHSDVAAIFMISQAQGPPTECPGPGELGALRHRFICCCCALEPTERPTAEELLHHPYLASG